LGEKCNVDNPYTNCRRRSDLISVPDRNTGNLNKLLIWGDHSTMEMLMRTYTRRIIKSEEADVAKKEDTWNKGNDEVSVKRSLLGDEKAL